MRGFLFAGALLASGLALGQERYDHHGALGLTVAGGGEFVTAVASNAAGEVGLRLPLELGATLSVGNHVELRAAGRFAPGIPPLTGVAGSAYAGIRNSFGYEQLKTFFDLDLGVHFAPFLAIGVRGAFGVQYDFLPIMGVYAQLGAQLGGATSLRLSAEVMIGLQFRTYLFE
jgi:hypothetical protein